MSFPVFDLHCDNAYALLGDNLKTCGNMRTNDLHFDLSRAMQGGVYAQCFSCFTSESKNVNKGISPVELFERQLATFHREIERNGDLVCQAYTAQEIEKNREQGRVSAILTIEGPSGFGYDPELLEDLYRVGFRITTLCWNEENPLTGTHITGGGLTDLGREYVREAQRTGMIIDVSHISDQAFWDIIEMTNGPVIASHSNSRNVFDVSRNITDDMFLAICRTGGVAGLNMYADFVGQNPDISSACAHVLHFLSIDPDGTHVALGGDLDGCDRLVDGFAGVQDYQKIAECLQRSGVCDDVIHNIFWNNALGVISHAVCNNKKH